MFFIKNFYVPLQCASLVLLCYYLGGDFLSDERVGINLRLAPEKNSWLNKRASEMGISKNGLITLIIDKYIDEDNMKKFLPEILKLKDEFEKNGVDIFNLVGREK